MVSMSDSGSRGHRFYSRPVHRQATSKQARTIKVSKVTKRHCAGTVQSQGEGYEMLNRWVLSRDRKLLTPMCLCHQAVQFGTGQRAVMLCGREGNRRSGVALAMRHRL